MKKVLFTMGLALLFAGCSDDYTDWAQPKQNAQEAALSAALNIEPAAAIDYANVTTDSVSIYKATFTAEKATEPTYKVCLKNAAATDSVYLNSDKNGKLAAADLKAAIEKLYGKRPNKREIPTTVYAYTTMGGASFRLDKAITVTATLVAPVIEDVYYLVGTNSHWTTPVKFNHSTEDVYDDPIFTMTVPAPVKADGTRADAQFKIVPASCMKADGSAVENWNGALGSDTENDDTRLEAGMVAQGGSFLQRASDGAKYYTIKLNMMDYTMTIAPLNYSEYIYAPGTGNSWTPASAPALHSANFNGVYEGFAYLKSEFKFTKQRNWDNGEYNWSSFTSYPAGFTGEGTGNIKVATSGYYKITADVPSAKFEAIPTTWGIIGDATAKGWDGDEAMTFNEADESWTITTTLKAGTFKFRANGSWDINFGGSANNLIQNGDNLSVAAGTYTIKLYLSRKTANHYYCTITKQ